MFFDVILFKFRENITSKDFYTKDLRSCNDETKAELLIILNGKQIQNAGNLDIINKNNLYYEKYIKMKQKYLKCKQMKQQTK